MRSAMADQARVEKSYAEVVSPVNGRVAVWAARQGEVVTMGETIVSIMDLTQTWIYAPLPETQADSVKLGDSLRVVMPSGGTLQGKIINKAAAGGLCDAARCERAQAGHQDNPVENAHRQPRRKIRSRHDG